MAFTPMETGYKPEFSLGAWVAGENAANQQALNQEEIIKQMMANQREQQMQPLDVGVRQTEAERARISRTPEMLDAFRRVYTGQADSQEAAGKKAIGTWKSATDLANLEAGNKISVEELMKRLNALKAQGISGKFNTQGTTLEQPVSGFNWQVSPEQQNERDTQALALRQAELVDNPNDQALIADTQNLIGKMNQGGVPTKETTKIGFKMNTPNRGMQQGTPEYEQLMSALMDTPELRAALLKGDQKADSAEWMKMMQLQNAQEVAAHKAAVTKAENESQMLARLYHQAFNGATEQERAIAKKTIEQYNVDKLSRNPAAYAPAINVEQTTGGKVPTETPLEKATKSKLAPQDQQALDWANKNPTDQRAIAIKKKLGVQ